MRMQDSLNNYPMYQITIISIKRRGGQYHPLFYGFFMVFYSKRKNIIKFGEQS